MVFDSGSERDQRALERLATDKIAWLTTVTPDGQPQTLPVWFLWQDGGIVIYGDNRAQRNRNLAANPKVSFHFSDDGTGSDIVFIEGEAMIDGGLPRLPEHAAYVAKYADRIAAEYHSTERFAERYNVPIVIRPVRGRSPY
jgi:PPOX class probable F420-dependent enzyme